MDIILIGRVAEAWTLEAVGRERERLEQRYGMRYLMQGIAGLEAEFADDECMRELTRSGCDVFVVGKQGINRALWALGETLSCGLRVNLCDIPISQFAVEISEFSDENPYLVNSLGCILACCEEGRALKDRLNALGYPAEVIGYTTGDNIRGLINHGTLTYLTPYKETEEKESWI